MPEKIIRLIACSHCKELFAGSEGQEYWLKKGKRVYCKMECRRAGRPKWTWFGKTLEERFLEHVKRLPNGCLECDYPTSQDGYPKMQVDGKPRQISHVAWYLHFHKWPPPKTPLDHICHIPELCDGGVNDPHRRCAEWSHLKLSTHDENTSSTRSVSARLQIAKGVARTECSAGHKLTPENTFYDPHRRGKQCRECARIRSRNTYYRKRDAKRHNIDLTVEGEGNAVVAQ